MASRRRKAAAGLIAAAAAIVLLAWLLSRLGCGGPGVPGKPGGQGQGTAATQPSAPQVPTIEFRDKKMLVAGKSMTEQDVDAWLKGLAAGGPKEVRMVVYESSKNKDIDWFKDLASQQKVRITDESYPDRK